MAAVPRRIQPQPSLRVATLALCACVGALAHASSAPQPYDPAAEVMRRAHAYVVGYEHDLSGIVAEERWEQRMVDSAGTVHMERTLRSDYLVFQILPEESWFAFRDVFEVDGEPVRDREERFQELFGAASGSAIEKAMKISAESARYNIGNVYRTINVPTFALAFLRPANRSRFVFEKIGEEVVEGAQAWVMRYREVKEPTFIATRDGKALKSRGRFWIEPGSGRIVGSELVTGGDDTLDEEATITVTYRPEGSVMLWVPAKMTELYRNPRKERSPTISGSATYSNYRRFELKSRLPAS